MSMIDKGVNSSLFSSNFKGGGARFTLKLGMLAIGVSLGILTSVMITEIFEDIQREPVIIAILLLFGGVSLIANFLIERKMDSDAGPKKDEE
ncbi:MAG: hypothetical protein LRY55_13745 [Leadbetterella sp.]|nr:hypothetical protein [Leadbetterella sp.]